MIDTLRNLGKIMALASSMEKFFFVHIPKNAGTSFKTLLRGDNAPLKNFITYISHSAPSEYFTQAKKRIIVLRDPGERFCSAFYSRLSYSRACLEWAKENKINSPEEYIRYLIVTKQRWNPIMSHGADHQSVADILIAPTVWVFQPQSLWFRSPNTILLHKDLNVEWKFFCDATGVPFIDLPRINISQNSLNSHNSALGSESMSFLRHIYSGDYALWDVLGSMRVNDRTQMKQGKE